jgi:3-hydroxyisobutyrate dehydrogenase-like beta-hydroxyacid dehydrogenase
MTTAILGTGLMGTASALRLQEQGHDVIAWNRHAEAAQARR